MTNRTLLWKYLDQETVDEIHKHQPGWLQKPILNSVEDCDAILKRAPWIPSYDEWSERLGLSDPTFLSFNISEALVSASSNTPLVAFSRSTKTVDNSLQHEMTPGLLSLGDSFAYGMLFRYLFDFSEVVLESVGLSSTSLDLTNPSYSIALHSRHPHAKADGCDISDEKACIRSVLSKSEENSCSMVLLADRECTAPTLQAWVKQEHNCTFEVAPHPGAHSTKIKDHGPFAGVGFFQDWALAMARTRDAFIGSLDRTGVKGSSWLVRSSIEFNRKIEAFHSDRGLEQIKPLNECMMFRSGDRHPN